MIEKKAIPCPVRQMPHSLPASDSGSGRQTGQYVSPWSRGQTWLQAQKQVHSFGGRSHIPQREPVLSFMQL